MKLEGAESKWKILAQPLQVVCNYDTLPCHFRTFASRNKARL